MIRHIGNTLTVLSLLLCICISSAWATGLHHRTVYKIRRGAHICGITLKRHWITYTQIKEIPFRLLQDGHLHCTLEPFRSTNMLLYGAELTHDGALFNRLGFAAVSSDHDDADSREAFPGLASFWIVDIPNWFLVLATGLLPCLFLGRLMRRCQHRVEGMCSCCGYDLRATADQCPECGTIPNFMVEA